MSEDAAQTVAYWSEEVTAATTARNDAIRDMRAQGASLRVIAEAAGLSHTAIAKILAK